MQHQSPATDVHGVARLLGLSAGHLNNLRIYRPAESPPFFRVGRRVIYPLNGPTGLEGWIAARTQGGTMPAGA